MLVAGEEDLNTLPKTTATPNQHLSEKEILIFK